MAVKPSNSRSDLKKYAKKGSCSGPCTGPARVLQGGPLASFMGFFRELLHWRPSMGPSSFGVLWAVQWHVLVGCFSGVLGPFLGFLVRGLYQVALICVHCVPVPISSIAMFDASQWAGGTNQVL